MKKLLLFVICCAMTCLDVMAWSGGNDYVTCSVDYDYGVQKVVSTQAGGFADLLATSNFNQYMDNEDVIFSGPMNAADLQAMSADIWKNVRFLDFSNVTGLTADDIDNLLPSSSNHRACMIIMPKTVNVTPTIIKDVIQTRIGGDNGKRNYGFFKGGNTGVLNVMEGVAYNSVFSDFVNGLKYIYSTDETVGGLTFHYQYVNTNAEDYPTYGGQISFTWASLYNDNSKTYPTFFEALKAIPVACLDFSGMNANVMGYSLTQFNENTHYFIIPINTAVATVNFSDESDNTQSRIEYNDNVWVVANVKGTKYGDGTTNCPYSVDYRDINTENELKESAVITYVRKAGELGNAEQWAPNEYKNATHSVILGKLNAKDLSSMANMTHKCMDLSYAEFVDGAAAKNLTCTNAHYVALPYNSTKESVDDAYQALSNGNLKCVIAFVKTAIEKSEGVQAVPANTLISYSKEQGQVNHAQYMVKSMTGNRAINVNNIIMSGHLNAADICQSSSGAAALSMVMGNDGHLYATGNLPEGVSEATGYQSGDGTLYGSTVLTMDFTNAIFRQPTEEQLNAYKNHCPQFYTENEKKALVTDMNFSALGYSSQSTKLLLPTDPSQKVIPKKFINTESLIYDICIPSNFEYFMDYAFSNLEEKLAHVSTTATKDDKTLLSSVVDHGWSETMTYNGSAWEGNDIWGTYTLASTVKYIAVGAFDTSTDCPLKDVYVLAKEAPICEKDAFCALKYFGHNGFNNTTPICRDNYKNQGSWIAVLHFPNALNDEAKKKYTDIDRRYFLSDETGAVDGDGNPIAWPVHTEFMRSWHQALFGYTWNEWPTERNLWDPQVYGEIYAVGGEDEVIGDNVTSINVENAVWDDAFNGYVKDTENPTTEYPRKWKDCESCGFTSYIGWHQFLLAQSDYFYEPEVTAYKQTPWYSFCIPYNMTRDELRKVLGNRKTGQEAEVRTLVAVKRNTQTHFIDVIISQDLVQNEKDIELTPFTTQESLGHNCMGYKYVDIHTTKSIEDAVSEDVYVKGGYPYFVRGWIPESEPMPSNLGAYVLAKSKFDIPDLGNLTKVSDMSQVMYTKDQDMDGYVAMPFFSHTVDAIAKDYIGQDEQDKPIYEEHFYGNNERASVLPAGSTDELYKYNFVGNYNASNAFAKYIPAGTYYMSQGKIYRSTQKKNVWKPWICVISHNGVSSAVEKIISETSSYLSDYTHVLPDYLWGNKEYTGEEGNADAPNAAKFAIFFEEDYADADGMVTGVRNIETAETTSNNKKVYSISGQCVGTSTNGLQKGIYVINGKKVIVE